MSSWTGLRYPEQYLVQYARQGVERIVEHVARGEFKLIVPMAH
jgi:hypothetical protein